MSGVSHCIIMLNFVSRFTLASICLILPLIASGADVIFKDKAGRVLTREDIQNAEGAFSWEIRSDKKIAPKAVELHDQGRALGQRGDYQGAIAQFDKASKIEPSWPYPMYDAAYTYLLQGKFKESLSLYEKVVRLSPNGFFTSITAADSLAREARNEIPAGTYLMYLSLEWAKDDNEKRRVVDLLIARVPTFAPAWKEKAYFEDNDEKKMAYLEKGLAANPDAETKGFLLINKALVLQRAGQKTKAIEILGTLALDPKSPLDISTVAKKTLAVGL